MKPRMSLLAVALAIALPVWAQNTPAAGSPQSGEHGAHAQRTQMMERMKAGHERRLQELKLKLQLSAEQEPAWAAFASAMTARPTHSRPDMAQLALLPTPERIERMKALREQRQAQINAQMDQRAQAARSFYNLLQEPQKKVFDEETGKHLAQRHHRHG